MTDIERPNDFAWGRVIEDHTVGPYTIREFHPRKVQGAAILREIDTERTEFHGYIDGKTTGESWPTLEDAMAGLIVHRIVGFNSRDINYHFVAGLRAMTTPQETPHD
ncbi:hypothetical protein [Sulfitobacter sp. 20_GPM-1509m]|uniref:hypothetical protein n=1 Tax=Sulfitobacter sp. 20_GPM-1509m TaxID=1380367 RepID=UPI00048EFB7A|nr:hypothetical protein [Sulfitobacter sp. 20_GPM-1509m]